LRYGLPAEDDDSLSTGIRRRLASLRDDLLEEVRWAFEDGQFELHYLPKLDITRRSVTGVEALLRWQHPLRGEVPLREFFPLIQDSGLIVPVGDWVLQTACTQIGIWRRELSPELIVAVNCAPQQFALDDFVTRIGEVVESTNLDDGALELELTESSVMTRAVQAASTLDALRALGTTIAIDDFGTGYSSLAYLKRFPVDRLKIDRSFVRDIPQDANDVALAKAIIALAQSLNLGVVAEGVETEAQRELLKALGCQEMQGFLFSAPRTASDLADLLTNKPPVDLHKRVKSSGPPRHSHPDAS